MILFAEDMLKLVFPSACFLCYDYLCKSKNLYALWVRMMIYWTTNC